jgi:hypothetical protein
VGADDNINGSWPLANRLGICERRLGLRVHRKLPRGAGLKLLGPV